MHIFLVGSLSWDVHGTFREVCWAENGGRPCRARPPQIPRWLLTSCHFGFEVSTSETAPGSPPRIFGTPAFLSFSCSLEDSIAIRAHKAIAGKPRALESTTENHSRGTGGLQKGSVFVSSGRHQDATGRAA